ncbi:MAG: hypothetical protein DKM24_06640 [Candidatus Melainabacteria bacterium]|nr:MAG: hypothetical protein DKM24_06640 [Candidatus Melainabacteria bacterium]
MKKNLIIISLIFALPLIAYAVLSGTKVESATQEHVSGKPQIIKFSSKLCSDCKKMKGVFETVMPQYSGTVEVIEYDIEKNDKNINNAIDTYNVNLVPTVVYIDKNGKVVRKTEGYIDKHKFEAYVKEILN